MIFKIITFLGMVGCLTIVYLFETAGSLPGVWRVFHWPAMTLTGIGPFMLVCVCSDPGAVGTALKLIFGQGPKKRARKTDREAFLMHELGTKFYVDGPKTFEDVDMSGVSKFMHKIMERLSIRMPMTDIREFLNAERDRHQAKTSQAIGVLALAVKLTPSIGMLGTILGMVQLLSSLSNPSEIGGHMSLALLTTFWGLFFSLAVWTPLQQKLERVSEVEHKAYSQAAYWIELLEKRKPASYFAESAQIPVEEAAGGGRA